jgi:3-methyl-2-oxobutanoate hydroxymethyltransferase
MHSITLSYLQKLKQKGEKITCLTVYDATFAHLLEEAGIEVFLIGDSLGMAIGGHRTTVPVTMQDMRYHTRCVSRVHPKALLMADMPFASYANRRSALKHAAQLMQAGAHIVKLEGGLWLVETIQHLAEQGIPSCAHLGLTPQAVHLLGGYKVQGRDFAQAQEMIKTALALEAAGAKLLVLECVPHALAKEITANLRIPTIGIGAGSDCDGQVLVLHDMLGLTAGKPFTFVQNFLAGQTEGVQGALKAYRQAVKSGSFPTLAQSFV